MNKIAIVGHPSAGYHALTDMLHQRGLAHAQPSKREQLSPAEITATLCQAHQVPPQAHMHAATPLVPLKIGPVWQGLALDLLLGNLDQKAWFWADPRAIFTLDYWCDIDPELGFILVYDGPGQALSLDIPDAQPLSPEKLDHWASYNRALLSFYYRHRQRCLLVHAQQAGQAVTRHLQTLLDIPLLEAAAQPEAPMLRPQAWHPLAAVLMQAGIADDDSRNLLEATAVESYLTFDLLLSHPVSAQIYEELQAAANLPWDGEAPTRPTAEQAWQDLLQQRQQVTNFIAQLLDEKNKLKSHLDQQKKQDDKELQEENELLLLQLHQVQEELERYFLENQRLKQGKHVKQDKQDKKQPYKQGRATTAIFKKLIDAMSEIRATFGILFGLDWAGKRKLTYRLFTSVLSNLRNPANWRRIPITMLHEAQKFKRTRLY